MNIEEIEQDLIRVCDAALAKGWILTKHITFNPDTKKCCALGAHYVGSYPPPMIICFYRIAHNKYGLDNDQTADLAKGFDCCYIHPFFSPDENNPFFQLGLRLNRKYNPKYPHEQ